MSDGYSSDNSREIAAKMGAEIVLAKKVVTPGKGAAMQAGLEAALRRNPDIIVFLDSDIWNLTPEWVDHLVDPLILDVCDMTRGSYFRAPKDGAVTQLVATPLLGTFFPEVSWLEQPLSGEVAAKRDVWKSLIGKNPPDGWGIDVWFLLEAALKKFRIKEVFLGCKEHKSFLNHSEDLALLKRKSEQVAFTIINEAITYRRLDKALVAEV